MIFTAHTHHLVQITSASTPDDPALGVVGQNPTIRWQGDIQALLSDQTTDEVIGGSMGGQRITVYDSLVTVPWNIPVWPNMEDILTLRALRDQSIVTFRVRKVDDKWMLLGQLRITCRAA